MKKIPSSPFVPTTPGTLTLEVSHWLRDLFHERAPIAPQFIE